MKNALIYLSAAAFLASGCHRGESTDSLQRQQQQYDTVQEGQSSTAVTSTITAPGEAQLPNAGMTGTNADTTTNFTLPQVSSTTTTQSQPGTIAGTMTVPSNSGPLIGYPANPPRPKPRPAAATKSEPAKTEPAKTEPARTDTATTPAEGPPPATSTTPPTTDTAPPPPSDTQPPPTTTTG